VSQRKNGVIGLGLGLPIILLLAMTVGCSGPTSNKDNGYSNSGNGDNGGAAPSSISGKASFTALNPPAHNVKMAVFYRHPAGTTIGRVSNVMDLGTVASVEKDFVATITFPVNSQDGDLLQFEAWVDTNDNNDWEAEPLTSLAPFNMGDPVFGNTGDTILRYATVWNILTGDHVLVPFATAPKANTTIETTNNM